jgi:D-alanyl-D-alanine carboxypeptidase
MPVERLQELLNGLVSRKDVRHAVVAVERGDGSFRWIGAAGEANPDGTPMRPETPFFIASVDKLCIATVTLQLQEVGLVGLDQPLSTYLPHALIGGLHRLGGVDYTDRLTVRHLLGHTSGLPDYIEDFPKGGQSLVERITEGDFAWSPEEALGMVRERLTPHFPPQPGDARRQKVRYSDTNYLLLRVLIEAVTGQPLHAVFEARLFRPLEFQRTWVFGYSAPASPTLPPATLWLGPKPLEMPLALRSLWSVYSTADEMLRFLRALTAGELFADPATLALMQRRWNRFGLPLDRAALRGPGWPIEYGLGMMRFRLPRVFTPFAPVPAVIGHSGSTGSWLFHCPERDLFLTGTVDQVTAGAVPYRFVPKLLRAVA